MTTLVLEDNLSTALDIELLCKDLGINDIHIASTTKKADDILKYSTPDLVISDILLEDKESSLDWLSELPKDVPIIIITNNINDQFYNKSQSLNAQAYLVKPVNPVSLKFEIEKIIGKEIDDTEKVLVKDGRKNHLLRVKDIIWILAEGNYSTIKTATKRIVLKQSLSKIESTLNSDQLFKCHRSAILNIDKVESLNNNVESAKMIDGTNLPISRNLKKELNLLYRARFKKL